MLFSFVLLAFASVLGAVSVFNATIETPIATLLIPTLAGDSLEDYSNRLAEKWKIGKDNGVILLVVLDERMARIQVGSKLKGALPDDLAKAIISEQISPRLRNGDFYGGISQGHSAIRRAISENPSNTTAGVVLGLSLLGILLFGLVLFLAMRLAALEKAI